MCGRQKIKVDDYKFAICKDDLATGRVKELLNMEKHLKDSRKQFDTGEGRVGLERGGRKPKKGGDGKLAGEKAEGKFVDRADELDDEMGDDDVE